MIAILRSTAYGYTFWSGSGHPINFRTLDEAMAHIEKHNITTVHFRIGNMKGSQVNER
jgi:hypothetical protein